MGYDKYIYDKEKIQNLIDKHGIVKGYEANYFNQYLQKANTQKNCFLCMQNNLCFYKNEFYKNYKIETKYKDLRGWAV